MWKVSKGKDERKKRKGEGTEGLCVEGYTREGRKGKTCHQFNIITPIIMIIIIIIIIIIRKQSLSMHINVSLPPIPQWVSIMYFGLNN